MKNDPQLNRTKWEQMSEIERNSFIHKHVLSEDGEPLPYSSDYEAASWVREKLGLLYDFDVAKRMDSNSEYEWSCFVRPKVESLTASYEWGASTPSEAVCLAAMHALGILTLDSANELRDK